jgi:putative oxidoreductase
MIEAWAPRLLSVLRIVVAFVYLQHGTQKLFAVPIGIGIAGGTVQLASRLGAAGVIEIVGGTLLLLGLCTRPVAFVCSGEMAFAYFLAHARRAPLPIMNQGELPVLFCFVFLYFAAAGGGPWSLDVLFRRAVRPPRVEP